MAILIVDDNQVNRFVIEKILMNAGYTDCVSLPSAHELFEYLQMGEEKAQHPAVDLILLDIMMPEIDGIEACRRLQQNSRLKDIPIIFVTALEDSNKLAEALDVGGIDYIMKPINKVELLARIRVALRLKYEKDWHANQEKKIRDELDLAMQVQRSLLSEPVHENNLRITASYLPSFKLAGDMYYWHKIDEKRYGVILLDMMGHGISASLVCMFISSVLRDAIKLFVDPEWVIKELNRYMLLLYKRENYIHYYFTAIYLVIDTKNKTVEYVNAGHPQGYALLDGEKVQPLDSGCCAVGFFEDIDVQKSIIHYEDSIQIFLFTDGVTETLQKEGDEGLTRLQSAATTHWDAADSPIDLVLPQDWQSGQADDMCIVMVQAK